MDVAALRERAADLPREPGVYTFQGEGAALYVGKAVDLRSRVRSYADPRSDRIGRMVAEAVDVEVAVTDTETQALLLEANLIKRHRPRYNVRLTDDKSYPLVQLTDHDYPRIEVTRDPEEAATVFGPYTDKGRVDEVIKALRETFGVRGCSDHKFANRDRPCLDHDIGLCTAPCTGEIGDDAYVADVGSVRRFLEGSTGVLADPLRREMAAAAEGKEFERAGHLRDRLAAVEAFHGGGGDAVQTHAERENRDVLGVVVEGEEAVVSRLHAEGGKLVERERHVLEAPQATDAATALAAFVPQYYAERDLPDVLVLSDHHGDPELSSWLEAEGVEVAVPGAGRDARLVDLALKNARRAVGGTDEVGLLAEALGLDSAARIEGVDVSHAQGKAVVGSDVCFVDGAPEKSGYRRKKLEEGNDDPGNIGALVRWRAERAVEGRDDRPDPDLLLVDGGEAQLAAAIDALDAVGWAVPAVALAKAEEVVVTPDGRQSWPRDAPHLHLLQRVRDEAHRFAVRYHQTVRDEIHTVLDDVPGVGPERRARLLRRFGSVEGVRAASLDELRGVPGIGEATAGRIRSQL
ncbi:MAG: excinuclease ABC subunit C [Halobacteriales archaeon]|nr:excinuclease ABC subunit C [Halobacteriales archaeon]